MRFLKPHTKKWFAAIARYNPWQAAVTMEYFRTAASANFCSFCGDKPARDYSLRGPLSKIMTYRLCDRCARVRHESFREEVVALRGSGPVCYA